MVYTPPDGNGIPYEMVRLFHIFDSPERRNLMNENLKALADAIVSNDTDIAGKVGPEPITSLLFDAEADTPDHAEGLVFYDEATKTLAVYNDKEDVTLQLGQEMFTRVVNKTGVDIPNGSLVYISGVQGNRPTVALAKADAVGTAGLLGIATHLIENNLEGLVTTYGLVRGVDTEGTVAGTHIHLSDSTAGEWQGTSPVSPSYAIQAGIILVEHQTQGIILVTPGPIDVLNHMSIQNLWVNTQFGYAPASKTVTAVGGIDPTSTLCRVQSDGGRVTVTASPQIAAGADGQQLILHGVSDINTVILQDGIGLHLHGTAEIMDHDQISLQYHVADAAWEEVSRNFPKSEKAWSYQSRPGGAGSTFVGGFYFYNSGNNDFSSTQTLGNANVSYAAHAFVVLGELAVDEIQITVTGTSITDLGVRTTSDTEVITIPDETAADAYFETAKKWIGQVSYDLTSGTGKQCNWGFAKYWDNSNADFRVRGLEATWIAGASDTSPDLILRHHKITDWTYNAGSTPTPPTPLASLQGDHVTEYQFVNTQNGAWKRTNLNTLIQGGASEGTIVEVVAGANRSVDLGNFLLTIVPS